ncbi:hypothetical protein ACIPLC_12430 [Kitasatospora sp. NPDC086801]|uniref:hypothetical protein n=1 Tax=Kitasatospora sp. NPDC086801 TaxID=3364066 RepID=UPI0037F9CF87
MGERLGRPVGLTEIGMGGLHDPSAEMGLDFARDPADAVRVATTFWSNVDRRDFLGTSFAVSAFTTPVTRWLVRPADLGVAARGSRRVGRRDVEELWDAAAEARRWDYRAHGRAGDARAVAAALSASETLLGRASADREPAWIGDFDHARMSADATEIYRDLHNPKAALDWNAQAVAMSPGTFTRSVGLRMTVVGMTHLQARDLDQGLELGNQAVDILTCVRSARALGYVHDFTTALAPWKGEVRVAEFIHRTRTELAMAS